MLYEKGIGNYLKKDIIQAQKYYQKAADGNYNNSEAQNRLGLLYYKGKVDRKLINEHDPNRLALSNMIG